MQLNTNTPFPSLCRRHGKAPWDKEGDGHSSGCAASIKGCGCAASVKASLDPKYAAALKLCSSTNGDVNNAEQEFDTSVFIRILPEHTGHNPEEDTMVNMVTIDTRVKEFIQERAKDYMLPISCIASDVRSYSDKLTAGLNVSLDNRKFYPTEQSIAKFVRRLRQQFKLDPEDNIAVEKFIEQDMKENPGR